ncbi:type II toxin-antitoxin system RelE/ParE family toxin [Psychrobacter sp. I-STPA10]|uniref:type II toxin-antitoxin system RelE/ParE family toxin n=1 Tax=Psychrobacter sp. I-STPA10 TaxID=2585769 RepID=UPI001E3D9820|nr:type II toxin-antitoxin system RelE/ParE family toxin [Psychrobacter sp. I-STPA10]
MTLEIETTEYFDKWLSKLKNTQAVRLIALRLLRLQQGHFGDAKSIGAGVSELKINTGAGYRIYYTMKGEKLVLLLIGGDKSSQSRDIEKAQKLLQEYEKEGDDEND